VGAALGAKLAAPDRLRGGDHRRRRFIFANPTACHWAAEAHELPILMVIFNNARYGAVRNATLSMFASARRDATMAWALPTSRRAHRSSATREAHGAFAARVERPADLPAVLAAARDAVLKEKRHALVNVITPY
jgi:acetolactate synthase-1/2/3 large subunit